MFEEYQKPESEQIPPPPPSQEYLNALELIKKHNETQKTEKERELPRSISPIEEIRARPCLENFRIVEGGLAECPNCHRTFFPDRLVVHLKS